MNSGFADELLKISEQRRDTNSEEFKQFMKNTGVVAAGAGLGVGAGMITRDMLKRYAGPASSKWRTAAMVGLPLAGGVAAMAYKQRADQKKKQLLEEAYQRGLTEGRGGK